LEEGKEEFDFFVWNVNTILMLEGTTRWMLLEWKRLGVSVSCEVASP
jgi:hypothetical protein